MRLSITVRYDLKHRCIENIRNATEDELAQAPSMNRAAAEKVYAFLHNTPAVEK